MAAGFSVYYIVLYCIVFYVCAQSCPTVCDHMDCSLPGSSVHGFLQARILEWVATSPGDLPDPGIKPGSSAMQAGSLPTELQGKHLFYNNL